MKLAMAIPTFTGFYESLHSLAITNEVETVSAAQREVAHRMGGTDPKEFA